jgi:hypothetical protein
MQGNCLTWHLVAASLDTVRSVNISLQMPLPSQTNHRLLIRRQRKIAKNEYQLRHGHPSVRMHRLGSQWTDFHENLRRKLLFKPFRKIQVGQRSFDSVQTTAYDNMIWPSVLAIFRPTTYSFIHLLFIPSFNL